MKHKTPLVRDTDAGSLLEMLLVVAVVTLLVNRAFLAAAGYPKIAHGNVHIAHMLWGGFLMFSALVVVFRYWNPSVRRFSALLGGMGFGLFVDELGKFITNNNDYFYKPTISIIYIIFIFIFLLFRGYSDISLLTNREILINKNLRRELGDMSDTSSRLLLWYDTIKKRFNNVFTGTISLRGVLPALMILFVLLNLIQLGMTLDLIHPAWFPLDSSAGFSVGGTLLSGLLVLIGVFMLKKSLMSALIWFKRAVLVSIFITQIFLFYYSQLAALRGLAVDLIFYSAVEYHLKKKL